MNSQSLGSLHDATLDRIAIDWEGGTLVVDVTRVPGGPVRLLLTGIESFSISRLEEWGPSIYINGATFERLSGDEASTLDIEMQSGDRIVARARELSVVEVANLPPDPANGVP